MTANLKEYIRLCSIPAVQEKIVGNRKWITGDLYYNTLDRLCGVVDKSDVYAFNNDQTLHVIRLPQVHDLMDEKRGLWGMVDWKRWAISLGIDGSMVLDDMDDPSEGNRYSTDWNTPTLALLKALAWQEGV